MGDEQQQRDHFRERVTGVIHPWSLIYATIMADADAEILKCEKFLDTLTWDASEVPHYVEWGPAEAVAAASDGTSRRDLLRPEMFNNPDYQRKLRPVMTRARVLARRFGFFGVWMFDRKRMINWFIAYLLADAPTRAQMDLPYGIIDPTKGLFVNCRLAAQELVGAGRHAPVPRLEVEFRAPPRPTDTPPKVSAHVGNEVVPPGIEVFVYADSYLQYSPPP